MKLLKISAAAAVILASSLSMAMAGTFTKGTVKKVDEKAGKVTIIHEELIDLEMPAMTMVFRADEEMISKMSEGQDIEFVADRVNGKLTVVELK
ncbi:copper-binding protein [Sedimentitalea todarodis]|uniref:copper-binding protein n=1 Tax=Sedimentitalea todarodis TaxID=1631240 RepID=UPI0029317A8B|nr:copper-binding protein [Sedimentitalea todarodis]